MADELDRARRAFELALMAQPRNPYGVAPENPGLLSGTGIPERLALLNQMFNPVEAIGQSMQAGGRLTAPNAGVMDRVVALGDMLSGVAGVTAPAAAYAKTGAPAATALMEGLLGWSPTREAVGDTARSVGRDVIDRLNQPGQMPTTYSNPIPGLLGDTAAYAPEQTQKAYKLFRVDKNRPGELFPLFVNANDPVEIGKWLRATAGDLTDKGQVKSKIGPLAYRPGWHAGDSPMATHIGAKSSSGLTAPDIRPPNQVWAEVDLAADKDWQSAANAAAQRNKSGVIIPRTAHITDQVPYGGFYRYKTNPNMTGDWLIGGDMRVNRVLTDDEVRALNEARGVSDLPRAEPSLWDLLGWGAQ